MDRPILRLNRAPQPSVNDPHAQLKWIFFQVEAEKNECTSPNIRHARNTYLRFVSETKAYYNDLEIDPRFYLDKYWEPDALIRFNKWLNSLDVTSKTKYAIYKNVRQVMDMAYALRIIDQIVYHAPMFKGVSETKTRSAYAKREQEVINAALAKWISLAIGVIKRYCPTGAGTSHQELKLASTEAERSKDSVEDVVPRKSPSVCSKTKKITIEGIEFESMTIAAKAYGVNVGTMASRINRGATPEESVGVQPFHVKQYDHRALLWMFENTYKCDPVAMYEDIHDRKLTYICSTARLRSLFFKWGVWPYIDAKLIMPLAVEFAMLTGLNVESVKMLELDSYASEHPLTGQPCISYRKRRSGSARRSEDKELHIATLEIEELYLEESVSEKIEKVIAITKELTSRIRSDAPHEIASRLFIFEDVEKSKKAKSRVVVPINPKGKTISWRSRFAKEEGLLEVFGKKFSFNIARCRPTLATNLVLAGADLFQVKTVLGHKSVQTTAKYLDGLQLQPVFNKTVLEALQQISRRSQEVQVGGTQSAKADNSVEYLIDGFHETLSGCGCKNAYNPSENVRKATKYVEGSVCKYWNMCLLCDNSIVTQSSLPKLISYSARISQALAEDTPSIKARSKLYEDTLTLIKGILEPGNIFPKEVIDHAFNLAATQDDLLIDQLVYQGI